MLSDALKQQIQTTYSHYLEKMGYKPRSGQRYMIAHIAKTIGKIVPSGGIPPLDELPPVLAVEAGTGTGKTLAYAIAAIPIAKSLGKKLIVSTATVALQEQIAKHDFPSLQKNGKLKFDFAIAKGRRRYVCKSKLVRLSNADGVQQDSLLFGIDGNADLISREGVLLYPELMNALANDAWDGDLDEWPDAISYDVWQPLTADNAECTGRRCPYISECAVFNARDAVDEADVIITNHDLVLADIGLGGGVVLPAPEDTIYVFDEAHNVADKALSQFTYELRYSATLGLLEKVAAALTSLEKDAADNPPIQRELSAISKSQAVLSNQLSLGQLHFLDVVDELGQMDGDKERYRYPRGLVPDVSKSLMHELHNSCAAMQAPVNRLNNELEAIIGGDDPYDLGQADAELWYGLVGNLKNRLESITALSSAMAATDNDAKTPTARWVSKSIVGNRDEIAVNVSAVSAGESLQQLLWSRASAVVLTSATLTALGQFERFTDKLGLPPQTQCERVASPFDYYNKAVLRIPAKFCEARDRIQHTQAITEKLHELIGDSRAVLVLFSARSQLNDVYDGLDSSLRADILRQDDYAKHVLVEKHKKLIDEGKISIVFGLSSLAEGLNLPGKYCDHVIIAKLPFSVPNDPVAQTESEWFDDKGRNYFMEVSVPDASLKLIQSSGRLLRNEADEGIITLLDNRVLTKRYGSAILASLPPYRQEVV